MTDKAFDTKAWSKALNADPAYKATKHLAVAMAERELVLLREPNRPGKKYDAWDKDSSAALDKEFGALERLTKTTPTTAVGAVGAIDTFLRHSVIEQGIEEYPEFEQFLKRIREYLLRDDLRRHMGRESGRRGRLRPLLLFFGGEVTGKSLFSGQLGLITGE